MQEEGAPGICDQCWRKGLGNSIQYKRRSLGISNQILPFSLPYSHAFHLPSQQETRNKGSEALPWSALYWQADQFDQWAPLFSSCLQRSGSRGTEQGREVCRMNQGLISVGSVSPVMLSFLALESQGM